MAKLTDYVHFNDEKLAKKYRNTEIPMSVLYESYFDGELDIIDTSQWYGKIARKEYAVGLNLTGSSLDEPDANFFENYACNSERNYTKYCNADLEKLMVQQSSELDQKKREANRLKDEGREASLKREVALADTIEALAARVETLAARVEAA